MFYYNCTHRLLKVLQSSLCSFNLNLESSEISRCFFFMLVSYMNLFQNLLLDIFVIFSSNVMARKSVDCVSYVFLLLFGYE